ncbi:MAG TPA: hypothetical protein DD735_09825 [Clostridiales bacterium]|nr:hypothetical protein [Clostridiales bacterium]
MYIALRPVRIAGHDYRINDEIPDDCVTSHRLEATGFIKRIPSKAVSVPILGSDGSVSTVDLEPEDVKAALVFLQQTPANAAKSVPAITSQPLLDYLKLIDGRKAVQEAFNAPANGGGEDARSTK